MPQYFHPASNAFSRATIAAGIALVGVGLWVWAVVYRSPYSTEVNVVRHQPVPFSHEHHISGLGLDCRYCHLSVEKSAFAGIPPTQVCMGCHSQIWKDSPMLEPVRASFRTGEPLEWTRVHDLPGFVYFDHSIHIAKGVGCESCHGRVDQMPLMRKVKTLQMEFCLECHRDPGTQLRERDQVFRFDTSTAAATPDEAKKMVEKYHVNVRQLTDCFVCHR
ncbi:MAG TPA: cytochrome c3 family protein [Pirellulales bacterium]|nr:cytochrome c3 family protein [Pirellulales bacterium]